MHVISKVLSEWYAHNKRDLAWRNTTDAYRIWLSEVILQQTRVAQGTSYYNRFVEAFPTVRHLAMAHEDAVLKLWQGLGYYSRARNLHKTAKIISSEYGGVFPNSYRQLLALPGIGHYTAAAIASFAFAQATPVLDGNVYRVLARLFAIQEAIDVQANQQIFHSILSELIQDTNPALFNQSIMEFGALQCVPQNPDCDACPLIASCVAYNNNMVQQLPFKSKKTAVRNRFFNYIFIISQNKTFLKKRVEKDIWQNLYEPFMFETDTEIALDALEQSEIFKKHFSDKNYKLFSVSKRKHVLTHQRIFAQMFVLELRNADFELDTYQAVAIDDLSNFAIPRLVELFLMDMHENFNE